MLFFLYNEGRKRKRKEKEMNPNFKKYLSCIILILLCLAGATVLYVSASDLWQDTDTPIDSETDTEAPLETEESDTESDETETESETESETETNTEIEEIPVVVTIDIEGTILTEYISSSSLRAEWALIKNEGEDKVYLSVELYLDSTEEIKSNGGVLTVNGEAIEFNVKSGNEKTKLLTTYTSSIDYNEGKAIEISATIDASINENGVSLTELTLFGTIVPSEEYMKMASSHLINIEHISQYPELPSGDEITSLAMVLAYLNYDVDKCDLCDLYLKKGPVGFTDFNEANVGNPRNAYNSYGCLPPVLIDSATKFISVNGGQNKAYDYSGKNVESLYYEVSKGNPIIVWVCENFDITPSISRIWVVDGKQLYLKSNMASMVLVGYDYEKNTVTLANPAGTVFEIDMDLFEERYLEMGAYSIAVK